jgi:hypothetical protein
MFPRRASNAESVAQSTFTDPSTLIHVYVQQGEGIPAGKT